MHDTAALLAAAKQGQTLGGGGGPTHLGSEVAVRARGAEGVVTDAGGGGDDAAPKIEPSAVCGSSELPVECTASITALLQLA